MSGSPFAHNLKTILWNIMDSISCAIHDQMKYTACTLQNEVAEIYQKL